jgi:gamma-glutamylaminecyclotransferase
MTAVTKGSWQLNVRFGNSIMRLQCLRVLMHKVFVYGTLKQGFPNYGSNNGIRFRGEFETLEHYPLILVGERFSPWFILDIGKGNRVKGQVFDVSNDALIEMDLLERIDEPDGYQKTEIKVRCNASKEQFNVLVYAKPTDLVMPEDVQREIEGEYLLEHAQLYSKRDS